MAINSKKNGNKGIREQTIEQLNNEFETLLTSSKDENGNIRTDVLEVLAKHFQRIILWRLAKWTLVVFIVSMAVYYIPLLNWNAAAIGRLIMIHFIKPVWDWEHWANARCLIDSPVHEGASGFELNVNDLLREDCAVCENLDTIDSLTNATYKTIQNAYLLRNIPVVVKDSHKSWADLSKSQHGETMEFTEFLQTQTKIMESVPCNLETNLLWHSTGNIRKLFKQVHNTPEITSWFLHFRNCQFSAVKASRTIFGHTQKPYYLSSHLPPFYSSWILISQNYDVSKKWKQLKVRGLVMVLQLSGSIECIVEARSACFEECGQYKITLLTGEALIFMDRMWDFHYRPLSISAKNADDWKFDYKNETSITFIKEIEWNAY